MENSLRPMFLITGIFIFSLKWIFTHQQMNVALGGITVQSSMFGNYPAYFAIDGISDSIFSDNSCSCTNADYNPWWRVDLLAVYDIRNVIITNRLDCCQHRIDGAEIHIGNSLVNNGNNNPRCAVISSIPDGNSANYTCNMRGRYVNVIIPNMSQFLTLCEVEVYGVPVPVFKMAFLKMRFNSSENLGNPTTRDKVLEKIKSANVHSPIFRLNWAKEPELETGI